MKSRKFIFSSINFSLCNSNAKYFNFKSISRNQHLGHFLRYFSLYMYTIGVSQSKFSTKLKLVCLVSGRSRGLVNVARISRLVFKEYATDGYIFGFKKSQW